VIEKLRERERDDIDGRRRACFHAFEMIYWHRETQKALRQSFQQINVPNPEDASTKLVEAGRQLIHHTKLLGDELGLLGETWPEEPIDQGAWYEKVRQLMAHVTAGDACPSGRVCEALGGMMMLGKTATQEEDDEEV